jgi:hypothetical protein
MEPFAAFVAIDWSDAKHDLCLVAVATGKQESYILKHTPEALEAWATALRETPGSASLSSSTRLGTSSGPRKVNPVIFPPGRARLATSPSPTGSPMTGVTMGTVVVACCAARAAGVFPATMRSTLRRTSSVARVGNRSSFPSAARYSMTIF